MCRTRRQVRFSLLEAYWESTAKIFLLTLLIQSFCQTLNSMPLTFSKSHILQTLTGVCLWVAISYQMPSHSCSLRQPTWHRPTTFHPWKWWYFGSPYQQREIHCLVEQIRNCRRQCRTRSAQAKAVSENKRCSTPKCKANYVTPSQLRFMKYTGPSLFPSISQQ